MTEAHHEDPFSTGKDLPSEGQVAASIGRLLGTGDKYLNWARLGREDARRLFSDIYSKIEQSDMDRLGITDGEENTDNLE